MGLQQLCGNEIAFRRRSQADSKVQSLGQKVEIAVGGKKLDRDIRVPVVKHRQKRDDSFQHEGNRRRHAQGSPWLLASGGNILVRRLDLLHKRRNPLEIGFARLRQRQLARAALEQPLTKLPLDCRNRPGHMRGIEIQRPRGSCQAAKVADEQDCLEGLQIHSCTISTNILRATVFFLHMCRNNLRASSNQEIPA